MICPGGREYRPPTRTCGRCQSRTLQVISPLRIRSRKLLTNCIAWGLTDRGWPLPGWTTRSGPVDRGCGVHLGDVGRSTVFIRD